MPQMQNTELIEANKNLKIWWETTELKKRSALKRRLGYDPRTFYKYLKGEGVSVEISLYVLKVIEDMFTPEPA